MSKGKAPSPEHKMTRPSLNSNNSTLLLKLLENLHCLYNLPHRRGKLGLQRLQVQSDHRGLLGKDRLLETQSLTLKQAQAAC